MRQLTPALTPELANSAFMKACRGEKPPHTPVWLMRQAGRYMKEYREIRSRVSFMELCHNPELATEVTVYARNRIGADAAILFADILLVLEALGRKVSFVKGDGPSIEPPLREPSDIEQLRELEPDALNYVYEAVRLIRRELPGDIPLIGFAGAPFTVASYLIEGGPSRDFVHTKRLIYNAPEAWHRLMGILARGTAGYLCRQVEAGAQAIQLFDSWVGCLSPDDYREFVLPHSRAVLESLPEGVPRIHFGKGTALLLELFREAGGDVVGVDFMTPLRQARERLGAGVPVQGNLDPVVLLAGREAILARTRKVLEEARGPGHIFNLGHGILPQTPVDDAIYLIDKVHELTEGRGA